MSDAEEKESSAGVFSDLPIVSELPLTPVHCRVLDLEHREIRSAIFAAWQVDPTPSTFFRQVRERVESALLTELSLPGSVLLEGPAAGWDWCRLLSFHHIPEEHLPPLELLGFRPCPGTDPIWSLAMTRLRAEAHHVGFDIESHPPSSFEAQVLGRRDPKLLALAEKLTTSLQGQAWGARPGEPWQHLAALMGEETSATLEALDRLEASIVSREVGVIRWIPPSLLQAACDLIGAIAAQEIGLPVQWAHCEADEQGIAPPPLLRVDAGEDLVHIPIALHLLRWWVMPLREGEEPSPLSAWIRDQFGDP